MDEVEYKLKTNNSVLIVNGIDKLISTIKSKYKPVERQKFVLENEELKFLREKCSSKDVMVSLTACQGLLALVELGVLEISYTMSTVVTLLPSTHNYSAIISTMAGLLILDLKSRLVPGQPYKCQFSLRSPQHPFITVLEKNKDVENDVLAQMHALCTHPEYTVSSNSLELLRPVFLWLTCNPQYSNRSVRPWQMLLSLPQSPAQSSLLLTCLSCQQICDPKSIECAFAAYSAVVEAAIYQQRKENITAFLPMLARICGELIKNGRDPRSCYNLIERCFAIDAPELRNVAGLTLMLLAENLTYTSALYLHELFNLCLNIISKYEYTPLCLNTFVGLSLQWLHLPSYLTNNALKVASKIIDMQTDQKQSSLFIANLKTNKTFQTLVHTDGLLYYYFKLLETYERVHDDSEKLKNWFDVLVNLNDSLKLELLPFFIGVVMDKDANEDLVVMVLKTIIALSSVKKEVSVIILPVLLYKIANDSRPSVKLECLRGLPVMASTKENVPTLVSILNKFKANRGVPTSLLIMLYTSLAETQVRCFPYLQEMLGDSGGARPDELRWEIDIAKAIAVKRICEIRPSSHGLELVPVISGLLNRCTDRSSAAAAALALSALRALWRGGAVAPAGAWRALQPKLAKDTRPAVLLSLCELVSELPGLRVGGPEYEAVVREAARRMWALVAEASAAVARAACQALAGFKLDDYKLKDVPEIYRRTVKLPASYCKTPADAARNPEDVLDYIPCEIWPELFKHTNVDALPGIQNLVSKLMEREIRGYRSGVYQVQGRELQTLDSLPPFSVVRGMMDCFRKQVTSPSYEYPEAVLLSMLECISSEFPKPLPPLDLCFLHEVFHRGQQWKSGCIKLAARQASTSGSAKRLLENFLQSIVPGTTDESDIMMVFDYLPILCRTMPPNNLRPPLERCLADSFSKIPKTRVKGQDPEELVFVKQITRIKECLESEKIHDANRTLLSKFLEDYFSLINDDNVVWPMYVVACSTLAGKYLERMTSPDSWWEVSGELIRKASALRARVATSQDLDQPLLWLNEAIDAHVANHIEHEFSLQCMLPALQAARASDKATREWFSQLMARTQVVFNESEELPPKLYLCDVFFLSVIVLSGRWSLEPAASALVSSRNVRRALLPAAAAALAATDGWADLVAPMLEWFCHTRDSIGDPDTARCCQHAVLALRHTDQFKTHKIFTKLVTNYAVECEDSMDFLAFR